MSACARRLASSPTPTAAPTTSRPAGSLVAKGNFSLLVKSLTVISPRSRPVPSTSGSFSTLCSRSRASASSLDTPAGGGLSGKRRQQQDVVEGQGRRGELSDVAHDTFRRAGGGIPPV